MRPSPGFNVLAKAEADSLVAIAVFHNQSADESVWRRLETMFNGDLDPTDDLVSDASDKCALVFGALREGFDPGDDVVDRALVSELFDQEASVASVPELD